MAYNMDEPCYTFGAWTMVGDGWPNCESNLPPPEEDELHELLYRVAKFCTERLEADKYAARKEAPHDAD